MLYKGLTQTQYEQLLNTTKAELDEIVAKGYKVDIARGKPCNEQLDITMEMFDLLSSQMKIPTAYRNYGLIDGIPEMKKLMGEMLGVAPENVIMGGSSSLNLMYDCIQRALQFGILGEKSWNTQRVKFICPTPGYDRHFAITEHFGIEMINVPMTEYGPNMDIVEKLVADDESVKGMWCVPKYSNPTGCTYSEETVRRLATMPVKAKDFRIFWDNAYGVHDLTDTPDVLANIMQIAKEANTEDRIYEFTSTSKITFAGSGVSCMAMSDNNLKDTLKHMNFQMISYNKVNQYAHYLYMKDMDNVHKIMKKQAQVIKPKFDKFIKAFEENFETDCDFASWTNPNGGYFITLTVAKGCAKRVGELCKSAGLTITNVGAAFPYGRDESDEILRIAPTFTSDEDIDIAIKILIVCVKIAALEKFSKE